MKELNEPSAIAPSSSGKAATRKRGGKATAPQTNREQLNSEAQAAAQTPIGRAVQDSRQVVDSLLGARDGYVANASDELAIAFDTMPADILFQAADKLGQLQEGRAGSLDPFQSLTSVFNQSGVNPAADGSEAIDP